MIVCRLHTWPKIELIRECAMCTVQWFSICYPFKGSVCVGEAIFSVLILSGNETCPGSAVCRWLLDILVPTGGRCRKHANLLLQWELRCASAQIWGTSHILPHIFCNQCDFRSHSLYEFRYMNSFFSLLHFPSIIVFFFIAFIYRTYHIALFE